MSVILSYLIILHFSAQLTGLLTKFLDKTKIPADPAVFALDDPVKLIHTDFQLII